MRPRAYIIGNDEFGEMYAEREITEEEILEEYWDYWFKAMCQALYKPNTGAFGKPELITKENCIDDWVSVHWARPVY